MSGPRTRGREIALQALFCGDVHEGLPREVADDVIAHAEASPDVKAFARELAQGVLGRLAELDGHIAAAAENWEVGRLAVVDRNVLRLAVYELVARDDIPAKVSINEAIELGKRFSTAQSGAFVNGILDRVRKDLGLPAEPDEAPADDAADAAPTSFSPGGAPGDTRDGGPA